MGDDHSEQLVDVHTAGVSGERERGGWAAVLKYGTYEKEISGGEPAASANRMDLTAAVHALERLRRPCSVRVHTTSTYLRDGITAWLSRWREVGWRTHGRIPANVELWQRLDAAVTTHDVRWDWADPHADDGAVQRAARLAASGMRHTADGEQECAHLMPIAWCSWCRTPEPGVLPNGYRTAGGAAYHNDPQCEWLLKGQLYAFRQGKNIHDIVRVAWGSVNPGDLQPCEACCTRQWLHRHGKSAAR